MYLLVEKSDVVPDTPSSSLYMIPVVTTYMILHQQLLTVKCAKNNKEKRKNLLRRESVVEHGCDQKQPRSLTAAEQKLHILRRELLHGNLIIIDSAINHMRLLLLQHDHARFNRVFNAKTCDNTRTFLANAMTAVSGLPFRGWVPPSIERVSVYFL